MTSHFLEQSLEPASWVSSL